jgi:co-chaperonin GroES (HSP10)
MKAPFKPLGSRILVEKEPYRPTMEGGILIPQSADNTPRFSPTVRAKVLAVGSKVQDIKPGDTIALKRVAGDDMEIDGRLLTLARVPIEIVGLIESNP